MNDHVYKTIEITGTSRTSSEEAVRTAIQKASTTVKNLRWFRVTETRGSIDGGRIDHWQVTMQIGFTLE
jgi:flavin-binding protein dodecin